MLKNHETSLKVDKQSCFYSFMYRLDTEMVFT